jgi:hypothetical protein
MTLSRKLQDPDPEVIRRAAAGNSDALYALLRALQEPIFGLAVRMLRHRADAEDATQEALLRIVTHLGQFRSESRFSTWAWRIAVSTTPRRPAGVTGVSLGPSSSGGWCPAGSS